MRYAFRAIVERVWQEVPVRPRTDECLQPDYEERLQAYHQWADRQAGYIRKNGSKVGYPFTHNTRRHGQNAARRDPWTRHLRTVPRGDREAKWLCLTRVQPRFNEGRFKTEPFTPEWMVYRPASSTRIDKPTRDMPIARVVTPIIQAHQAEVRSVCRRFHKSSRTPSIVVPIKPAGLWKFTPVRPPLRRAV